MGADGGAAVTLAAKLDRLFRVVRPAGRGEYSYQEVASALRDAGGPTVSASYIWQLRKGLRDNPTKRHLEALASFFGVSVAYFFDDDAASAVDEQLTVLAAMRDVRVRGVALRAVGLSGQSLAAIGAMIEQARRLEGLPPADVDDAADDAADVDSPGVAGASGGSASGESGEGV